MQYFAVYKPYGMICQFSPEHHHRTLADLPMQFPKDCYPIGRLDTDSEGLLILSNDKALTDKLLNPKNKHTRRYWAQVEGMLTEEKKRQFETGLSISINGKNHQCAAAEIKSIEPSGLPDRNPPVRYRKTVVDSWVEITLTEGKNRQVRKMTAAIGLPTLRLIRISIEDLKLPILQAEFVQELTEKEIYSLLKIKI